MAHVELLRDGERGRTCLRREADRVVRPSRILRGYNLPRAGALPGYFIPQESTFWRRSLWERVGGLDASLHFAGDFDLWARFYEHAELWCVRALLGVFRSHVAQKSQRLRKLRRGGRAAPRAVRRAPVLRARECVQTASRASRHEPEDLAATDAGARGAGAARSLSHPRADVARLSIRLGGQHAVLQLTRRSRRAERAQIRQTSRMRQSHGCSSQR